MIVYKKTNIGAYWAHAKTERQAKSWAYRMIVKDFLMSTREYKKFKNSTAVIKKYGSIRSLASLRKDYFEINPK